MESHSPFLPPLLLPHQPLRKSAAEFEESANQFNELRRAYVSKRDAMANDAALATIIEDGTKKRNSLMKSVKKIVQGKAAKKSWSPHVEHYKTDPTKEFGDAINTLEKASKDLTKLEQELHTTKEDPKLLLAVIQEYHDLLQITNAVVDQTSPNVAARQSEWTKYVAAVEYVIHIHDKKLLNNANSSSWLMCVFLAFYFHSAELVEKKELKANPTELYKSILAYKEVRAKVAPQVGAKKKGGCAVM
jgi:hypothetical protein